MSLSPFEVWLQARQHPSGDLPLSLPTSSSSLDDTHSHLSSDLFIVLLPQAAGALVLLSLIPIPNPFANTDRRMPGVLTARDTLPAYLSTQNKSPESSCPSRPTSCPPISTTAKTTPWKDLLKHTPLVFKPTLILLQIPHLTVLSPACVFVNEKKVSSVVHNVVLHEPRWNSSTIPKDQRHCTCQRDTSYLFRQAYGEQPQCLSIPYQTRGYVHLHPDGDLAASHGVCTE